MIVGWTAVLLALLSLAPSLVPGAMSVIGLLVSLAALPLSLLSVRRQGKRYFRLVAGIVAIGALLVNDGLRIWTPTLLPAGLYWGLLLIAAAAIAACSAIAAKLDKQFSWEEHHG